MECRLRPVSLKIEKKFISVTAWVFLAFVVRARTVKTLPLRNVILKM